MKPAYISLISILLLSGCVASTKHFIKPDSNLNGYRYVYIYPLRYEDGTEDKYGVRNRIADLFAAEGLQVLDANEVRLLPQENLDDVLRCYIQHFHTADRIGGSYATVIIDLINALNQKVYQGEGKYQGLSVSADLSGAVDRAFQGFALSYTGFDPSLAFDSKIELKERYRYWERINVNEDRLKKYLDDNIKNLDPIEGIWTEFVDNVYRIGIFKDKKSSTRDFVAIILESETPFWEPNQVKIEFKKTAYQSAYTTTFYMRDHSKQGTTSIITDNGLLEMMLKTPAGQSFQQSFIKNYPAYSSSTTFNKGGSSNPDLDKSTGSGFLISKTGLLVTNWHVVQESSNIVVYFPRIDRRFKTKIVIKDSNNDLAILQLIDFNYDSYFKIPIPFTSLNSSGLKLGEEIFTLGFPLGEILGRSAKLSSGRISSLFGVGDDPRLMQISNPIQPGNSGSPLFNKNGELIGIVVSSLNAKLFYEYADIMPQNVNFAIKIDYLNNLIRMLPENIEIYSNRNLLQGRSFEQMVDVLTQFVVSIDVKQ